jgi:hypothetical protein
MMRAIAALLVCVCTAAQAQTPGSKPKVPPGVDPGGVAIAIIGSGLDYTDPEIAPRLARDGEGEIIGWDLVDGDNRPYLHAGVGTHLAKVLLSTYGHARLVPVRTASFDPTAVSQAIGFVMRTPARIVALPVMSAQAHDWLRQRAERTGQMFFVVAATGDRAAAGSMQVAPGNLITVAAAREADTTLHARHQAAEIWVVSTQQGTPAGSAEAAMIAAALAGCTQQGSLARTGFELKADLMALAQPDIGHSGRRVIEPTCPFRAQNP